MTSEPALSEAPRVRAERVPKKRPPNWGFSPCASSFPSPPPGRTPAGCATPTATGAAQQHDGESPGLQAGEQFRIAVHSRWAGLRQATRRLSIFRGQGHRNLLDRPPRVCLREPIPSLANTAARRGDRRFFDVPEREPIKINMHFACKARRKHVCLRYKCASRGTQ